MSAFPSPNRGERRGGAVPALIVIHYTAMADAPAARARLCDPHAEVSAHWLIDREGRAEQLVDEGARAWHAGAGSWGGAGDVNSRSIGIELDNPGDAPFPEPQMAALETLLGAIMARWGIGPEGVIGHSDMAPGRKSDPGPRFDWRRLALRGLALWPEPGHDLPPDPVVFAALAQTFGYPDCDVDTLLAAVRLRFRPRHAGPLDGRDMAIMADLAARHGADGDQWRGA